ncbi:MAG: ABC transporter permease [Chloroflexota bacterium]
MSELSSIKPKSYPSRPRWLKVFLDIWENRSRTILVVASITVGVFAVGMIIAAYIILETDMTSSYEAVNPANIEILTSTFDEDFVATVERLPGIKEAEGRYSTSLRVSQDEGETWRGLRVVGINDFEESNIFKREPVEGAIAPEDREMLIEARVLESFDVALGDQLLVQLSNGTTREVPVTGIVRDQAIRGGPNEQAVVYVSLDTLTWLGQAPVLNELLAVAEGDGNDKAYLEELAVTVEDRIEQNGGLVFRSITNLTNEHPSASIVLAILTVLGVMGIMMLVLGGSLIANTLTALLNQQMRQIGVMKLVGARSLQIVSMYLVLIIAMGLLSLIISIPLAAWGGYQFALFFGDLLSIAIGDFRFVPISIVAQIAIAIFIPILAGIAPVILGARRTVEDAISENDASVTGSSFFELIGESIDWISRPLLVSIRNTFRNVRRLSLTLFTLTFAGSIFIAVFNMQASLGGFIDNVGSLFQSDANITLGRPYRAEFINSVVSELPDFERTEGWLQTVGEIERVNDDDDVILTFLALPAGSELAVPAIKDGRLLTPEDAGTNRLMIAETIWREFPDLQAGDFLPVGVNGNRAEAWEVVGIYNFPSPDEADPLLVYAPYETIAVETNQIGMTTYVNVVSGADSFEEQTILAGQLDALLQENDIRVAAVEAGGALVEQASEDISVLVSFFLGMAVLTAIVGSIGLAGTMSMNVMDRIREIGILRAIGAVDSAVMGSVLTEGVFIGFISWILGIVFSFPITYLLLVMVSFSISDSMMPFIVNPTGYWLWLIVILALAALASIIPARNASRLTIREVLAYE